jgi:hypothetical protein
MPAHDGEQAAHAVKSVTLCSAYLVDPFLPRRYGDACVMARCAHARYTECGAESMARPLRHGDDAIMKGVLPLWFMHATCMARRWREHAMAKRI